MYKVKILIQYIIDNQILKSVTPATKKQTIENLNFLLHVDEATK